ncbi:unnamed protein product, partial [Closterium sp. Naga37s-1]
PSAADLMKAQRKAEVCAGKGAGARRRGCGWCDVAAWTGLVVSLALVGFGLAILILALTFNTEDPKFEILKVDLTQLNFGTFCLTSTTSKSRRTARRTSRRWWLTLTTT